MKKISMAFAALAVLASGSAFSQQWYGGLAVGAARSSVDTAAIDADLTGNLGFFTSSTVSDTKDSATRMFAGRNILPWLDVEAYYAYLGHTKFTSTVTPRGALYVDIKSSAFCVAALPYFSPMPGLKLFGKAGVARVEAKAQPTGTGFVSVSGGVKERSTTGVYGAGLQYDITSSVAARVEYDVHRQLGGDSMGGKFDVKTASLGVQIRF
jgi:opacity protein-like surface antigen